MTNQEIILTESLKLMEEGVLKGSGIKGVIEDENGEEHEIELPEEIHTFNAWKERGYNVKKGEKSKIKFAIWKYTVKKKEYTNKYGEQDETEEGKCFMKMSAFFTSEQVERAKA